nr:Uncharacterised protein [Klebsiella pneumoniae]
MVRQYASCARNALLERVDIIPNSMVATMAAAESGWGTSGWRARITTCSA